MKKNHPSQLLISVIGGIFGAIAMIAIFITISSVMAAPSTPPPLGSPEFPIDGPIGPAGPQGPAGATGATGAAGPTGPQGPAGTTVVPSQTIELNRNTTQTTSYKCTTRNLQAECGDADGCTIRVVMDHKLDGDDLVHVIEEFIYMENYNKNTSNGVYGWTRDLGGYDRAWISGNASFETPFDPWSWAWMLDHTNTFCYSTNTALPAYNFSFATHPHVATTFFVYD